MDFGPFKFIIYIFVGAAIGLLLGSYFSMEYITPTISGESGMFVSLLIIAGCSIGGGYIGFAAYQAQS